MSHPIKAIMIAVCYFWGTAESLSDPGDSSRASATGGLSAETLRERGFHPLFDGGSLEHWNVQPGHRGHWTVREGTIDYDGRAEKEFKKLFQKVKTISCDEP